MEKELKSKDDASPLTTSTESETFDTWTVISDKSKDITQDEINFSLPTPNRSDDDGDITGDVVRVEELKPSDDQLLESRYNDIDDLSDGISIISECESVERLSPHPELRKHLSNLNMCFMDVREPLLRSSNTNGERISRNYETSSERGSDTFHQMEPLMDNSNRRARRTSCQLAQTEPNLQPALRCGLRGLFYVGALLAVLAFISKLKYESVLGTSTELLNQKIDDLELKNNLMRAEIDILAKQVNYLTTLSETQKYTAPSSKPKSNAPKEKKIKVWPGNGNNIEEVEISPKDQKTPFKCENHNNVDIAGMCIELPKTSESVVDNLGDKVRVVIDGNEQFSNFEKVVDRMAKFTESPFDEPNNYPKEKEANPKETNQQRNDYTPHEHKPEKYESKKRDNEYKKKYNSKNGSDESKEKESSRSDRSNEDYSGSSERFKKSKEYKKYDKYSSSEYEKAKRDADGRWHEKLMQHRETARKNNDKHRHDKNWYIERGDSREQARVTEQKYR